MPVNLLILSDDSFWPPPPFPRLARSSFSCWQVFWFTDHPNRRAFPDTSMSPVTIYGFRPRSQRRVHSRFSRDSPLIHYWNPQEALSFQLVYLHHKIAPVRRKNTTILHLEQFVRCSFCEIAIMRDDHISEARFPQNFY